MAKHVLDLYELYRLVVSKGGLVEVINKKLWREITKGLNLPSSITSAAFTLRTQYMKYLYPYECEKMKMSTPSELQAAIDGNRREGRRPVYGNEFTSSPVSNNSSNTHKTNQLSQSQTLQQQFSIHQPHIIANSNQNSHHTALLAAAAAAAAAAAQHHNQTVSQFYENSNFEINPNNNQQRPPNQPNIPNFQPFFKSYFEVNTPPSSSGSLSDSFSNINSNTQLNIPSAETETKAYNNFKRQLENDFKFQEPNSKKLMTENKNSGTKYSKMNIKIYEKENVLSKEICLSLTLDFNGRAFEGILYPIQLESNGLHIQIPMNENKDG